jgi:hypothetical protein
MSECPNHEVQQASDISLLCKNCGEPMTMLAPQSAEGEAASVRNVAPAWPYKEAKKTQAYKDGYGAGYRAGLRRHKALPSADSQASAEANDAPFTEETLTRILAPLDEALRDVPSYEPQQPKTDELQGVGAHDYLPGPGEIDKTQRPGHNRAVRPSYPPANPYRESIRAGSRLR